MSSTNQTPSYGLCQWEPGDNFNRIDFNSDNSKLDAALQSIKTAGDAAVRGLRGEMEEKIQAVGQNADRVVEQLIPISYNLYQLMLQNYYDGKVTGGKKALIFDGFLDGSGVASKDQALLCHHGALRLGTAVQSSVSWPFGDRDQNIYTGDTPVVTAAGNCLLTGFTAARRYGGNNTATSTVTCTVFVNETAVHSESFSLDFGPLVEFTRSLTKSIPIVRGDKLYLRLQASNTGCTFIRDSACQKLAGTLKITSCSATAAAMTAVTRTGLPSGADSQLYLRHTGGTVTPSINGKNLTKIGERQSVTLQGLACTESQWKGPATTGSVAVALSIRVPSGGECLVWDYGLVVL